MNLDDLINKITMDIKNDSSPVDQSFKKKFNNILIPIPINIKQDLLIAILKKLVTDFSPVVILPKSMKGKPGLSLIIEIIGENSTYFEDETMPIRPIIEQTKLVLIPEITLEIASKINLLMADSNISKIILEALLRKIPVNAGFSVLENASGSDLSFTLKNKINELKNSLTNMGITFQSFNEMFQPFGINTQSYDTSLEGVSQDQVENIICTEEDCTGCGLCLEKNIEAVKNIINTGADRIGSKVGVKIDIPQEVAKYIDHTMLKPQVTEDEIKQLCWEAKKYNFAAVCVNPAFVEFCSNYLKDTPVKVATVIGFPLGATTPHVKAFEAREAISKGADEIDMVINIGALKSKNYSLVEDDIHEVVKASQGRTVKVILETGLLSDEEKVAGCLLSKAAGADFVKTSTGFGPGGATVEDIFLMRTIVGLEMGVKASGGVRDFETAQQMIEAGASRIGASAGIKIIKGDKDTSKSSDY